MLYRRISTIVESTLLLDFPIHQTLETEQNEQVASIYDGSTKHCVSYMCSPRGGSSNGTRVFGTVVGWKGCGL